MCITFGKSLQTTFYFCQILFARPCPLTAFEKRTRARPTSVANPTPQCGRQRIHTTVHVADTTRTIILDVMPCSMAGSTPIRTMLCSVADTESTSTQSIWQTPRNDLCSVAESREHVPKLALKTQKNKTSFLLSDNVTQSMYS